MFSLMRAPVLTGLFLFSAMGVGLLVAPSAVAQDEAPAVEEVVEEVAVEEAAGGEAESAYSAEEYIASA